MCKSKITRGKLHSGSNRNRAGKLLQLPPSNSRNFIDYPPIEIGPENSFNYPPSNSRDFIDYPPRRNRAGKLLQLPPSNSWDFIDYPPSKSGRKTPSTTPLEFTGLHRLLPLEIGPENSSTTPPRILELTGVHPPQLLRCGCAPGGNASMTQGGIDAPAMEQFPH